MTPSSSGKGNHPNSRANLKNFEKGKSGNPKGRPKGAVSLTTELKRQLKQGETLEKVVQATILQAAKGNGTALKIVWDRIDGPVKDETEHSGGIELRVTYEDPGNHATGTASGPSEG